MPYIGNDLRPEQIEANKRTLAHFKMPTDPTPIWTTGDSRDLNAILRSANQEEPFDMIFSCPPYADLEKYSDRPEDLSNMDYETFLEAYRNIVYNSCQYLKDNRFAVFVVGEVRAPDGIYRGFVQDTIKAFQDAGLRYYNELILVNQVSSGAIRARGSMTNRKPTRTHQTVLAFHKDIQDIHETVIVGYKGNVPNKNIQKDFAPLKNTRIDI